MKSVQRRLAFHAGALALHEIPKVRLARFGRSPPNREETAAGTRNARLETGTRRMGHFQVHASSCAHHKQEIAHSLCYRLRQRQKIASLTVFTNPYKLFAFRMKTSRIASTFVGFPFFVKKIKMKSKCKLKTPSFVEWDSVIPQSRTSFHPDTKITVRPSHWRFKRQFAKNVWRF